MTTEEAIQELRGYKQYCRTMGFRFNDWREALDMAIEALEHKRGEWIQHVNEPSLWSCSICETVIYSEHDEDRLKFHKWCGCCGADMRERREE